ncbi:MAG: DUF5605 domain-containing protein, partial [Bacteroidota bacterium]|nr:DUF5605 domain-containing protein [Bacteroidota bacterium]
EFTHVSIQDESPVQSPTSAAMLRNVYHKPVICDEVGYEGNLKNRWGCYSPERMLYLVLNGVMGGVYVTHGECFTYSDADTIFLAKGGNFKGTSWKRIAFLRSIVEACPNPLQLADGGRDNYTATAGKGYYLVSFGKEINDAWQFDLPTKNANYKKLNPGTRFKVEIIDMWDMTITQCPLTFEVVKENDYRMCDKEFKKVNLPLKPYLVLRITEVK